MFELDFFVQLDSNIEECVNGKFWADDCAGAVMCVKFKEIEKGFWKDYVNLGQLKFG